MPEERNRTVISALLITLYSVVEAPDRWQGDLFDVVSTQLDRAGWGDYDNVKTTTTGVVILTCEPEEKV